MERSSPKAQQQRRLAGIDRGKDSGRPDANSSGRFGRGVGGGCPDIAPFAGDQSSPVGVKVCTVIESLSNKIQALLNQIPTTQTKSERPTHILSPLPKNISKMIIL